MSVTIPLKIESNEKVPYFAVGPRVRKIICPACHEETETTVVPSYLTYFYERRKSCCCPLFACCLCFSCIINVASWFLPELFVTYQYCVNCDACLGYYKRP